MPRLLNYLFASCLFLLFLCLHVTAQSSSATLSGTVEDQNGAVLPGVTVSVENVGTRMRRDATTNDSGSFTIPLLPPGEYTVLVEREGFTRVQLTNIVLNVGDQKAVQVQLKVGDVRSDVVVTADPPLLRTDSSVGTVVDRNFVERMPLSGRSFQSLLTLTPGFNSVPGGGAENGTGQFSVNGQRASANAFIIDGVSGNVSAPPAAVSLIIGSNGTGNLPSLSQLGTTQTLISVDALQEFRIETSTYSAEYGRQPGGQVSMTSRSGTNNFHGSLFDYVRNDVFDANNWFANRAGLARPPLRQNNFGGTIGGPIYFPNFGEGGPRWYNGKNRTFFFFNYEGLRLLLPKFSSTNLPTAAIRQTFHPAIREIFQAHPLPNGPDVLVACNPANDPQCDPVTRQKPSGLAQYNASWSDPSTIDSFAVRLDHSLNKRASVFGRYSRSPSSAERRIIAGANILQDTGTTSSLTIGYSHAISGAVANDLRANWSETLATFAQEPGGPRVGGQAFDRSLLLPNEYTDEAFTAQLSLRIANLSGGGVGWAENTRSSQRQFNSI